MMYCVICSVNNMKYKIIKYEPLNITLFFAKKLEFGFFLSLNSIFS